MKKLHYNAPVVLTFFFLSLFSLLLGYMTGGWTTHVLFSVYRSSLLNPLTYLRMFTHVLGHANLEHFMGNMLLFLVVGPQLEEKYGSSTLCVGIVLTAFVSGLLQVIFFPEAALLGASGIVFMMILLSSFAGMKEGYIPITLILVAVLYLGREIYSMIMIEDNVANLMHLVGGACGTGLGFLVGERRRR